MNKKIVSELAIAIILLVSIIIGGIFWLSNQRETANDYQSAAIFKKQPVIAETDKAKDSCQSHYYEGESRVRVWKVSPNQNDESIVVYVKNEDVENLPIKNVEKSENFTVRLIDPTPEVKNSLSLATEKNPATITIKGYAEICQQEPPQVSLEQAAAAFDKRS